MNDGSDLLPEGNLRTVSATVKWFNQDKGFGFVELDDTKEDAFVITSYSIHYTKLYDFSTPKLKFAFPDTNRYTTALYVHIYCLSIL